MIEKAILGSIWALVFAMALFVLSLVSDSLHNQYVQSYKAERDLYRRAYAGQKDWEKQALSECTQWQYGAPPP